MVLHAIPADIPCNMTVSLRFDGDGMLHGVLFKDGAAAYTNKWVRTHQWKVENELGHEHYIKIPTLMDPFGVVVLVWEAIKVRSAAVCR